MQRSTGSMNLAIFGLSVSSSWGNGHAALWRGLIAGLLRDGHRVTFFERDAPWYAAHRDLWALPEGGRLVLYRTWSEVRETAGVAMTEADAAIVTSYCPDGQAAARLVLESDVEVRCFYDLDTPVTLARVNAGEAVEYLPPEGLGGFDLVLSYTGGRALDMLQTRLGARKVVPIYGSVDPALYRRVEARPHYRACLSYMGTYAADRQAALEQLFVGPARRRPTERFVIGGAQYPDGFPWAPNIFFVRHLPPDEHAAFYSSSRLTLNVTRTAMAELGWCPSGRLFEAAACGTAMVTDEWDGIADFFEPSGEILIARDTGDVMAALDLSTDTLDAIGRRARDRVLSEHSAQQRAADLIGALESACHSAPAGEVRTACGE
ncbi:MAG TPA: glycosyltransferase [Acetobacteraceae bacterium]